jgi:hypothetical protein
MRQTARVFACHSFGALPLRCAAQLSKAFAAQWAGLRYRLRPSLA